MKSKRKRANTIGEYESIPFKKQNSTNDKSAIKSPLKNKSFKLISSKMYKKVLSHIMEHEPVKIEPSAYNVQNHKIQGNKFFPITKISKYDRHTSEQPNGFGWSSKCTPYILSKEWENKHRELSAVKNSSLMSPLLKSNRLSKAESGENSWTKTGQGSTRFSELVKMFNDTSEEEGSKICMPIENKKELSENNLKHFIKSANANFVSRLEENYSEDDAKHSEAAPKLGRIYIEGKRCPKNLEKALKILVLSSLVESKYLLVKLAFIEYRYADAYHYCEYFIPKKWTWEVYNAKGGKNEFLEAPNHAFAWLEHDKPLCYFHLAKEIKDQILRVVGEKEAARLQKLGSNITYYPKGTKTIA